MISCTQFPLDISDSLLIQGEVVTPLDGFPNGSPVYGCSCTAKGEYIIPSNGVERGVNIDRNKERFLLGRHVTFWG